MRIIKLDQFSISSQESSTDNNRNSILKGIKENNFTLFLYVPFSYFSLFKAF